MSQVRDNRFAPPRSAATDVGGRPALPPAPKPMGVFLMQLSLGGLAVVAAYSLVTTLGEISDPRMSWSAAVLVSVFRVLMLLLVLQGIAALQRRRRHARWVGMAVLGLIFALGVVGSIGNFVLFARAISHDSAYRLGAFVGGLVPTLLSWFWLRAFGLSPGARAWFGVTRKPSPTQAQEP